MNPEIVGILSAAAASVLLAAIRGLLRWDLQRRLHKLAAAGDAEAMKRLSQLAAPDILGSGPTTLLLLSISTAVAAYAAVPQGDAQARAKPQAAKQCYSAADCDEGQRCERGRCVATAKKPAGPRLQSDDATFDEPWALWLVPRADHVDPLVPPFAHRDALWTRRRRL